MPKINFSAKQVANSLKDPRTWLAVGVLLLIVSLFFASSGQLAGWEISIFRWVYGWPEALRMVFVVISYLGSIYAAGVAFLYFMWRKRKAILIELSLVTVSSYGLSTVIKRLVGRPRPTELLSGVTSRELYISHSAGFPSGHTTITSALALTLLPLIPAKWRWLTLVWILLVGISRIYLGVHAPLDVIGGFGLGLACAGFIRLTSIKLKA